MNKIILTILFFFLIFQNGIGQTSPRLKKFIKYYKTSSNTEFIKSIEDTYSYNIDGEIDSIIKLVYSGVGQEILTWEGEFYEYDEHKLLKKKSIKRYNPDVDLWIAISWKEFEYNSNGCLIEETNVQNVGGFYSDKIFYERNSNCQWISKLEEKILGPQGDSLFNFLSRKYFADGISYEENLYKNLSAVDSNSISNKKIWIFNEQGNLVESEKIIYVNNPMIVQANASKDSYEYDEYDNIKEIQSFIRETDTTEWELNSIRYFHNDYDENDLLIKTRDETYIYNFTSPAIDGNSIKVFDFKNLCDGFPEEISMLREQSGYRFREEYIYEGINECIDLGKEDLDIQIYPNPSNGYIEIESSIFKTGNTEILIFSADGKVLLQKTEISRSESSSLVLSFLQNGFYILQLRNGKHFVKEKIVIAK